MGYLGLRLISGLIKDKSFVVVDSKGIPETAFFDESRDAIRFCRNFVTNYGVWPTLEVVSTEIGRELPTEDTPTEYLADLVRKRWLSTELEKSVGNAIKHIEKREPDIAVDLLSKISIELKAVSTRSPIVSYKKSGGARFEDYVLARDAGGIIGIETPWDKLNGGIQGWVDGSLNVVAAMSNTGKTWFLCVCADHSERILKNKVLFVTLEMSAARISRRLDAIRYKIPFGVLRDCELDPEAESAWEASLRGLVGSSEESDIYIVDKKAVRTVTDVYNIVQELKPDIVFIDGGYRFESDRGAGQWEQTLNVVTDLQVYAEKTSVPWIVTTQFGDSNETGKRKRKGEHVRAWNVRYGKEWLIHPDVLIGLYADDDLRLIKTMEVHVLKVRDADKIFNMFTINWDVSKMLFEESSVTGTDDPAVGDFDVVLDF